MQESEAVHIETKGEELAEGHSVQPLWQATTELAVMSHTATLHESTAADVRIYTGGDI